MPQALRDSCGRGRAGFGQVLVQGDQVIIPITRCRGPQQGPPAKRSDPCRRGLSPGRIKLLWIANQRWCQDPVLFDQHDPFAGFGRCQCRSQAGRPGSDHQHIAKGGPLGKAIRVCSGRGIAQPGRAADEPFVEHPAFGRTEKGLVIEPGRQRLGGETEHRSDIEGQIGPAVLAARDHPVIDKQVRCTGVGFAAPFGSHSHQRVGLFNPGGHDAARAVVLETAGHQPDAIGQQGRGQGIAGAREQRLAIECKADCAAFSAATGAAHGRASGPTARTASIAWVARWRVMTSQARQP